jgi:hypothetical protein
MLRSSSIAAQLEAAHKSLSPKSWIFSWLKQILKNLKHRRLEIVVVACMDERLS